MQNIKVIEPMLLLRKEHLPEGKPWLYEIKLDGYSPVGKSFDALVFGYYEKGKLIYASRTRNGFTPSSRLELLKEMKPLEIKDCPFVNLPESKVGR